MDFEILPQLVIILSMAGILVIVGKNFSKMKEAGNEELFMVESDKEKQEKEKFLYLYKRATRRINKENYQKKMAEFWVWFEKLLRKLRIIFLRVDGRIVSVLEQLRKKNIESLEDLRRRTEKNMRREKANEAFSKFWTNAGLGGKPKTSKEAAKLTADILIQEEASANTREVTEGTGLSASNQEDISALLAPEEEDSDQAEREEVQKAQTSYVEAVYSEPSVVSAPEEISILETGDELETEADREKATTPEEEVIDQGSDTEKAIDSRMERGQALTEEAEEIEPASEYLTAATEEMIGENEEVASVVAADAIKTETEEEKKIRTRREQEYIEILMKDPADIKAYWKLGLIYSKRRNYEDALACFRQIVKIDPTYTKAKQKAIELMEKMKGKVK